jgi:hypothetical protein
VCSPALNTETGMFHSWNVLKFECIRAVIDLPSSNVRFLAGADV